MRVSPLSKAEAGICERVQLIRESLGKTRAQMALDLGVTQSHLDHVESRRSPVRYMLAFSLTNSFSVNGVWLALGRETVFQGVPLPHPDVLGINPRALYSRAFEAHVRAYLASLNHPAPTAVSVDKADQSPNFLQDIGGKRQAKNWLARRIDRLWEDVPDFCTNRFCDFLINQAEVFISKNRAAWNMELEELRATPFVAADLEAEQKRLTYSDAVTYGGERNENSSNTMQKIAISQRIKSAREKLGLSQGQAAEKWNLRLQTLQQWEHGRREPRGLYRERIETILSEIEGAKAGK